MRRYSPCSRPWCSAWRSPPLLIRVNGRLAKALSPGYNEQRQQQEMAIEQQHAALAGHVIIAGFGRVGQNLALFLREEGMPYLTLDVDTTLIRDAFEAGEPVHYGDSSHPEILEKSGIQCAAALVVTFHDHHLASRIVQVARRLAPELPIVVRTRNDHHMEEFEQMGASTVVPESLESSLIVAARTLELVGIDHAEVERLIERTRDEHYAHLRGVFHGEEIEVEAEMDELQPHTVILDERARAIGRHIGELHLDDLGVSIDSVRRGGIRGEQVDAATRLREGDAVILQGHSEQIARAERRLLKG